MNHDIPDWLPEDKRRAIRERFELLERMTPEQNEVVMQLMDDVRTGRTDYFDVISKLVLERDALQSGLAALTAACKWALGHLPPRPRPDPIEKALYPPKRK